MVYHIHMICRIACLLRTAECQYNHTLSRCSLARSPNETLSHEKNDLFMLSSSVNFIHLSCDTMYSLTAGAMPWTDVIRACIDFKLQLLRETTDAVDTGEVGFNSGSHRKLIGCF